MKKLLAGLLGLVIVACAIAEPDNLLAAPKNKGIKAPNFSISDATCNEDAGTCSLTITKSGNTNSASTVLVQTVNGTATAGPDYNSFSTTLIFSRTQTSQAVSVSFVNDNTAESTETLQVRMTAGSNARVTDGTGIVTILDTDAVTPPTQTCEDGSVILLSETCPEPEPAPEAPDPVETVNLNGGPDLTASADFLAGGLSPSWGTGAIPGLYGAGGPTTTSGEGAFRFTCGGEGALSYDDPLLYPGQSGASHLHKVWGNTEFNADTTTATLAANLFSNCNNTANVLNRSAYWMPAMINDQSQVVHPDLVSVYYKRLTAQNPRCTPGTTQAMAGTGGGCVGLPNSIRFIFGWDPTNPDATPQGMSWYCTSGTGQHYANLDLVFQSGCVVGATLVADLAAANCWNGTQLDTPNHRDHVAMGSYGDWGYYRCPNTHPYVIPQTENKVQWTVTQDMYHTVNGVIKSRVRLSSDHMKAGAAPGSTMHADYIEQWVKGAKDLWMANCINLGLNCNGGDLGNGQQLRGASQPTYGWKNPNPRSAIPAQP